MRKYFIWCVFLFFLFCSRAYSYEHTTVHPTITANAIEESNTTEILKRKLNIDTRVDESEFNLLNRFKGNEFLKWVVLGSRDEDMGKRSLNHFYDPTNGLGLHIPGTQIDAPRWFNNSYNWAYDSTKNNRNFSVTLDQFEVSLCAATAVNREFHTNGFLYSLGQLVHLVEDCGVPAHVRNDKHIYGTDTVLDLYYDNESDRDFYEKYTFEEISSGRWSNYGGYGAVDIEQFNEMSKFWDWNKGYDEALYNDDSKGLAEFTNHNFVSKDTNLDSNRYLYPLVKVWQNFTVEYETIHFDENVELPDGTITNVVTFKVVYEGWDIEDKYKETVEPAHHMASFSYLDKNLKSINAKPTYSLSPRVLDEQAHFLIPRTVGYAAGFLNYFFRGQFSESPLIVRPVIEDYKIIKYTWEIKNTTSYDLMDGEFKILVDDEAGNRRCVATLPLSDTLSPDEMLPNGPIEITRSDQDRPTTPAVNTIYANEKINGVVVYRGTIGNEEGVAALVGCPLINIIPLLEAVDERELAIPNKEFDMTWALYSKWEDGEYAIKGNIGNLIGHLVGVDEFDAYDNMDIDHRIIGDLRFMVEELKHRFWDKGNEQLWLDTGFGELYKKANETTGTGPGNDTWRKTLDEIEEDGATLKDLMEIENCLSQYIEAAAVIFDTFPNTQNAMMNMEKNRYISVDESAWSIARERVLDRFEEDVIPNQDTASGFSSVSCGGGYYEDQSSAALKINRTYCRVDTSGLGAFNIYGDSARLMVYVRGEGDVMEHPQQIYSSSSERSSQTWDLLGGQELATVSFVGVVSNAPYEKRFISISGLTTEKIGQINWSGETYLAVYPEVKIPVTSLNLGEAFSYWLSVGLNTGFLLYKPDFARYRNWPEE